MLSLLYDEPSESSIKRLQILFQLNRDNTVEIIFQICNKPAFLRWWLGDKKVLKYKATSWTNAGLVFRWIYQSLGIDELNVMNKKKKLINSHIRPQTMPHLIATISNISSPRRGCAYYSSGTDEYRLQGGYEIDLT